MASFMSLHHAMSFQDTHVIDSDSDNDNDNENPDYESDDSR
jgi:hypothetical protein